MDFNPRPPCGGRRAGARQGARVGRISIHAPRVGGDSSHQSSAHSSRNFNPRPPCGGRRRSCAASRPRHHFNPRPPCGGRRAAPCWTRREKRFQSTPPVWGATGHHDSGCTALGISIHAPRVGGDRPHGRRFQRGHYFNPRPPCGGRLPRGEVMMMFGSFQSTPPVWGATMRICEFLGCSPISIHAPRVGGDISWHRANHSNYMISIHAPRVGGDLVRLRWFSPFSANFNPRPPCGGRPADGPAGADRKGISIHAPRVGGDDGPDGHRISGDDISIHAPRVGGDCPREEGQPMGWNFNPRPPCGGRPVTRITPMDAVYFNPRPPCGGRLTCRTGAISCRMDFNPRPPCGGRHRVMLACSIKLYISIHAPRVGGDLLHAAERGGKELFQSTPPVWGATGAAGVADGGAVPISIHAPRVGGDPSKLDTGGILPYFNPRPPCGGRHSRRAIDQLIMLFQSTPPVWGATPPA